MAIPEILGIVSLEDAKRFAGVTTSTNDRLIDELVQMASQMINSWLGYNVITQTYREIHDGNGGPNIWLTHIPVQTVDLATTDRDISMTVQYEGGDASRATVEVTSTLLRLRTRVSGVITTSSLTLADYLTMTALETAIELISGWQATIIDDFDNYSPAELIPRPAVSANDRDVNLEIPEESETDYELYPEVGRLYNPYLWDYGHNNIVVEYTAGYDRSKVPYDIKSACLELVKFSWDVIQHDSTMLEETIGDYKYKLADMSKNMFSEESSLNLAGKLQPYQRMQIRGV